MKHFVLSLIAVAAFAIPAHAQLASSNSNPTETEELDPFAPNVEQTLKAFDAIYEQETGLSSHPEAMGFMYSQGSSCYRSSCPVWAQVVRATQTMYLYVDGSVAGTWKVSTGIAGRDTPNFDTHPDGRIYQRYTSTKYPEGDYHGLGNMPYAVFISGGFAIHGTPEGNWRRLGTRASHGCIRVHPDNASYFNSLVREYGVRNVWITVQ